MILRSQQTVQVHIQIDAAEQKVMGMAECHWGREALPLARPGILCRRCSALLDLSTGRKRYMKTLEKLVRDHCERIVVAWKASALTLPYALISQILY